MMTHELFPHVKSMDLGLDWNNLYIIRSKPLDNDTKLVFLSCYESLEEQNPHQICVWVRKSKRP